MTNPSKIFVVLCVVVFVAASFHFVIKLTSPPKDYDPKISKHHQSGETKDTTPE